MKLKSLFAAAVLAAPALAFGASYDIDPAHSAARFGVKHMMVATVQGEFSKLSGTVVLDEKDLKNSRIEATIDATTISTRNEQRDADLRSAKFFDIGKFPAITFKSTEVKAAGKDRFKVTGDLTMHGVTRPVVLDVESPSIEVKDPYGNAKRGAVATTKLNRKDFGLTWNVALEAGGVMVSDEVVVTIDLELNRTDAKSASAK